VKLLVSAGEPSGDLYAAALVAALKGRNPALQYFGCAGTRMQEQGVRPVIDQSQLSVIGLVEVLRHLPAIRREFRRLIQWAERERPAAAILTDSSGFHLRVARQLKRLGIPVVYLVAPQAWAWRRGRVRQLKRNVHRLLCIFPFEEKFFRDYGVPAHYIGHPLARRIGASVSREEFFRRFSLDPARPLVALLPGSRRGEIARHLPLLEQTVTEARAQFMLGTPAGFDDGFVRDAMKNRPVTIASGVAWDLLAHADLALAASGTVTTEAALLGTPSIAFYRVSPVSWALGRWMVKLPFLTMTNLIAGRRVIPELIQGDATPARLASAVAELLASPERRHAMRQELGDVARRLSADEDPIELAANHVMETLETYAIR
jgi:lipid-A-disaccharide synthase